MNVGAGRVKGFVERVLYRLYNHLARVHSDADLDIGIAKPSDGILHGQSRQARSYCVVLVRPGRAEECHYSIALRANDDTLVAIDGTLHAVERGLQAPHRDLGIQVANEHGRVADIREQDGKPLALTASLCERLQQSFGGQSYHRVGQLSAALGAELATPAINVTAR